MGSCLQQPRKWISSLTEFKCGIYDIDFLNYSIISILIYYKTKQNNLLKTTTTIIIIQMFTLSEVSFTLNSFQTRAEPGAPLCINFETSSPEELPCSLLHLDSVERSPWHGSDKDRVRRSVAAGGGSHQVCIRLLLPRVPSSPCRSSRTWRGHIDRTAAIPAADRTINRIHRLRGRGKFAAPAPPAATWEDRRVIGPWCTAR